MGILKPVKKRVNGKLIIMDFRYVNPEDLKPNYTLSKKQLLKEYAVCGSDGKLYVNSRMNGYELLADIFEILMQEKRCTLEEYEDMCKKDYKDITLDNIGAFDLTGPDLTRAFAGLLVPIEFLRRNIEKAYYEKVQPIR